MTTAWSAWGKAYSGVEGCKLLSTWCIGLGFRWKPPKKASVEARPRTSIDLKNVLEGGGVGAGHSSDSGDNVLESLTGTSASEVKEFYLLSNSFSVGNLTNRSVYSMYIIHDYFFIPVK